jgi:hypothetical protein
MAYTPDRVASAFIAEGQRLGVHPVGIQECIAAGLAESGLRVLANQADPASLSYPNDGLGSNSDSTGALQQRGSQGWGTVGCRMDPACSAGLFYAQLIKHDYTNLGAQSAGWYVQQVQRSADPTGGIYDAQWNHAVGIYNRLAGQPAPVEGPGIPQANVDLAVSIFAARIGAPYVFGGMWSRTDVHQGTDCSGGADTLLEALVNGPSMSWARTVDTESWGYNYPADLAVAVGTVGPFGTVCAGDAQPGPGAVITAPPADAAAIIYLMHGGGGANSHMMIAVNDPNLPGPIIMETGGAHNDTGGTGQYASPNGPATSPTDPEWTDVWFLPGPITGGDDLTAQDSANIVTIMHALTQDLTSQSPFRALGEGAIWQDWKFIHNVDGMEHPQFVEWAAARGDLPSMALLETLAAANPLKYPDRANDITLAQTVLARVRAGGGTTPTPGPAPPVPPNPTPGPAPTPTPSGGINITGAQLAQWGKNLVTVLGAVATWATTAHDILGHFLNGANGTVVPVAIALADAAFTAHTIQQKTTAQKQVATMKGTPQ